MRAPIWALLLSFMAYGCGGEAAAPEEIQHSILGTWTGAVAPGILVEMQMTDEATGCCSRAASGNGRIVTTDGDTLHAILFGLNQTSRVFVGFGGAGDPMYGQFSGQFADAGTLEGVMIGPEAFGNPPAGPFGADSVAIRLHRE
jgi:hypothetical protein